tara:strand:+ start:2564 stop:2878 length:315 start_codon:yes stop_codon:yes gene_type:complete
MQELGQIIIKGMSCPSCVRVVKEIISPVNGEIINIDLEKALAVIVGPLPEVVIEKVCILGYELQFPDGSIRKMKIKNPQRGKRSPRLRALGLMLSFLTASWKKK